MMRILEFGRWLCRPALPAVSVFLFAAGLVLLMPPPANSAAEQPYHVLDHWKIPGEGGWDYLLADPSIHRLYITHGARVVTVNTDSGKPYLAVVGLHGAHGIALDDGGKYGFISDGGGNAVLVFDRSTLVTVGTIPAGSNPDGIVFEPVTQTVWVFNGRSHDVTVIDAVKLKAIATVPLPGKPEFPAVDGNGRIFDSIEDKNEIVRIDARTKTITAEWPAGCESPTGLALDTRGHRLFAVCHGKKMAVIDSNSGKVIATPAIGDAPDAANYSPDKNLAFASCSEGVLSVVDAGKPDYPTVETLATQRGAGTMTYDPTTDRIYLVTAELGERPEPTADNPHPRPAIVPDTFNVIVVGR